ncbi:hypothetical protein [Leeuwenhoekiella aestuarii]|uniref:Glycosyl transferase family 2 n=1 Tax=Leeuwenhoekiella aestuarii TaxID=2249426 RepID=A0A4Q0NPM8_9FLAO|nr:hypothetical protein [Leeuwenhoekiella aestuarii]RXG12327.1 hypothetical protein DSM04_10798 [Leeuwenhoekiella aestuarii]
MKANLKGKTAIVTTVVNFNLYRKTSTFFPKNIKSYVIDGRSGMHGLDSLKFLFRKLKNKDIDWLIMADEDVIFDNIKSVFETIDYMCKHNYRVAGVRDGGEIYHRVYNPFVINTFFSILNFKAIVDLIDWNLISNNDYIKSNEFSDDLTSLKYSFDDSSLKEPYYCFYLYLRRCGIDFLFLKSQPVKGDLVANRVLDVKGNIICLHTWYARCYKDGGEHTNRINTFIEKKNVKRKTSSSLGNFKDPIIYTDYFFYLKRVKRKFIKRIKQKLYK